MVPSQDSNPQQVNRKFVVLPVAGHCECKKNAKELFVLCSRQSPCHAVPNLRPTGLSFEACLVDCHLQSQLITCAQSFVLSFALIKKFKINTDDCINYDGDNDAAT